MKTGYKSISLLLSFLIAWVTCSVVCSDGQMPKSYAAPSLEELLLDTWDQCETSVDVRSYGLTKTDYLNQVYDVFYTNPRYFHVKTIGATVRKSDANAVATLEFSYYYTGSTLSQMRKTYDAKVASVLSTVNPDWSEAETALYLHDYLGYHCQYDMNYENYDAYTALVDGSAVCQGYALAYLELARGAGLNCYMITTDELKHAWNVVEVNGEWYHVDSSNDDGVPDTVGFDAHRYLLKSDTYMMADAEHGASDWYVRGAYGLVTADSTRYDTAFWDNAIAGIDYIDGGWLTVIPNQNVATLSDINGAYSIYTYDAALDQFVETPIKTVSSYWKSWNGSNVYTTYVGYTGVYDGRIYYTTPTEIRRMQPDGSEDTVFYTLSAQQQTQGYLYGLRVDADGLLTYLLRQNPLDDSADVQGTIQLTPETMTTTTPETTTTTTTTTTVPETTSTTMTTTTTVSETTTTTTTTTVPENTTTTTTTTIPGTTTTTTTTPTVLETTTTTTATTTPETTTTTTTTTTSATTTLTITQTTTVTTTTTVVTPSLYGDVDEDGAVSVSDLILLARFVAEDDTMQPVSERGLKNADVTQDRVLNAEDLSLIARAIARLVVLPMVS